MRSLPTRERRADRLAKNGISRTKALNSSDVPFGKPILLGWTRDAINIVIRRWPGLHGGGNVTQSRLPFTVSRLNQHGFRQIGLAQDILRMGVKATEFLMR